MSQVGGDDIVALISCVGCLVLLGVIGFGVVLWIVRKSSGKKDRKKDDDTGFVAIKDPKKDLQAGFVAIDVETANSDYSSICQLGLAEYQDAKLVKEWKTYIDPKEHFDKINIGIHGIDESTVKGSPTFKAIADNLFRYLGSRVVVCHTHFDRVAINQAAKKYGIQHPNIVWLDSAEVARRAWDPSAFSGYSLKNVADALGYEFKHHDALEDAKASGFIVLAAIKQSGLDIDDWLVQVERPFDPN